MLKRTKGRILLTMLVITGLAGTINNSTLSNQERKFAISQLKDTKTELLASIKGLSETQLNFRSAAEKSSIKECILHITLIERGLWDKLEAAMKEPAAPERRLELKSSDEDMLKAIPDQNFEGMERDFILQPEKTKYHSTEEILSLFKVSRTQYLKYVKTTTADLRNHFIQLPTGWIDCYQSIIFISELCNWHVRQIKEILADPAFPTK